MFRRLADRATDDPVRALALLSALAVLVRLVALGDRSMHWDEARVGYWTLRYAETGDFAYRPIIHGPFLPVVTRRVFDLLGPSAFAARLPVAVLGGLFPLVALLFRQSDAFDRVRGLSDAETVAFGLLLAVDPLLLYYGRFFRSDVPLAVFAVSAFGLGFRALATRRRRYVVAGAAAFGLALTTKENALVYAACVVGTAGVAAGLPALSGGDLASLRGTRELVRRRGRALLPAAPVAAVAGLLPVVFFYAPRGDAGDPSLVAVGDPARWPALVARATLGTWATFRGSLWAGTHDHPYLPYVAFFGGVLLVSSLLVVVAGGVGLVREWRTDRRGLVLGAGAWAGAALLGYPLGADTYGQWLVVHVVVPLAIPAAVGGVTLVRRVDFDRRSARTVAAVALLLSPVTVGVATSYVAPAAGTNPLVNTVQPESDMRPFDRDVAAAADDGGVLYVGDRFFLPEESLADSQPAPGDRWPGWWVPRLPLPWYTERVGADTAYARTPADVGAMESVPPVVIATDDDADAVAPLLPGYDRTTYDLRVRAVDRIVVFVDRDGLR